jgi:hypothetical protein
VGRLIGRLSKPAYRFANEKATVRGGPVARRAPMRGTKEYGESPGH